MSYFDLAQFSGSECVDVYGIKPTAILLCCCQMDNLFRGSQVSQKRVFGLRTFHELYSGTEVMGARYVQLSASFSSLGCN